VASEERIEVSRVILAPAHQIFEFYCDPKGHVAIDSSGSLMSASGEKVTTVGDTFVVHMDREAIHDFDLGLYDMDIRITVFEQDRLLEWRPSTRFDYVYGVRLEPVGGGTTVTSYCDWSMLDQEWKDTGIWPVISEQTLRATLGILDRTIVPRT
jgi:hypothetical protein